MIEKALHRYGTRSLWEKIDSIIININSIDGLIPTMKGIGRTFPLLGRVQIYLHSHRVVFFDQNKEELGYFEAGRVVVKNKQPIENYRTRFNGLAKYRRWNLADAIYFFGYAMVTYAGVPFILENQITNEFNWKNGFRVDARFSEDFHTHNQRQSFYFDEEGLLVRHDYHAEILGWFAFGAHFTSDFKEVNGFPIAQSRIVYARLGKLVSPVSVLHASLDPLEVLFR